MIDMMHLEVLCLPACSSGLAFPVSLLRRPPNVLNLFCQKSQHPLSRHEVYHFRRTSRSLFCEKCRLHENFAEKFPFHISICGKSSQGVGKLSPANRANIAAMPWKTRVLGRREWSQVHKAMELSSLLHRKVF